MYHATPTANAEAIESEGLRAQQTGCASANTQFDGGGVYLFCDKTDAKEFMDLNCINDYVIFQVDASDLDLLEDPEYAEPGLPPMSMIATSDVPPRHLKRA